jgi:protein gp37
MIGLGATTPPAFDDGSGFFQGDQLPALFTFASIEPMLGPVILDSNAPDWIICGGESGRFAREMDPQWARDLRDASARLGRKFFMKQMTGKKPIPPDLLLRQFPALVTNGDQQ